MQHHRRAQSCEARAGHEQRWATCRLSCGFVLLLAGCSMRDESRLDSRAVDGAPTSARTPESSASSDGDGSSASGPPDSVPLPESVTSPEPEPSQRCRREAEFVRLGSMPRQYDGIEYTLAANSSYLFWTHDFSGDDVRYESFRWTPGAGIVAIRGPGDEILSDPEREGSIDIAQVVRAASADGSTVIGARFEDSDYVGDFLWNQRVPQQQLDFRPLALSHDGSVVAGRDDETFVRWTAQEGKRPLPDAPAAGLRSQVLTSADGSVIAGDDGLGQLFRWTQSSGSVDLGQADGARRLRLKFMNDRGDLLIGFSEDPAGGRTHLVRWTAAAGLQDLAELPSALVSEPLVRAEGRVVAAIAALDSSVTHAFRWTEESGLQDLTPDAQSAAVDYLSASGDVLAGGLIDSAGLVKGFRWTEGGLESLGTLLPRGLVGAGGNVILDNGPDGARLVTFGDPKARGPLIELLLPGLVPLGWSGTHLDALSEDGGLLVGSAISPEGVRESWLEWARESCAP